MNSSKSFRGRQRMNEYAKSLKTSNRKLEIKSESRESPPLGVSVFHLCTTFTEEVKVYNNNKLKMEFKDVKVYNIEDLRNETGFIREKGEKVTSKEDGDVGASYVDCLEGDDHVGDATHMLSYSWGNTIEDITSALSDFCQNNNLDPKRVYVWICCLCVNQHRVKEKLKRGETVPFNSFGRKFKKRVLGINNLLCLMIPLDEPIYLKRIWCIYEYFMAIMNNCNLKIIMPSSEQKKLIKMIDEDPNKLFDILGSTKIEEADASQQSDKDNILALVEDGPGYDFVNAEVNSSLRQWIFRTLEETVKKEEEKSQDASTDTYLSSLLDNVGFVYSENGMYNEAIKYYNKSLSIEKKIHGEEHHKIATSYDNIGGCYNRKGDYDGSLKYRLKALAIRENVLSEDHSDIVLNYNNIGMCYKNKREYEKALDYYSKSFTLIEKVYGTEHLYAAILYLNIGGVYEEKGDYDKTMECYKKCQTVYEKIYGTCHPETALSLYNIGSLYKAKGEFTTALEYLMKSLAIREKILGKNHPVTARSYFQISFVYCNIDDLNNASKNMKLALESYENMYGVNDPETLDIKELYDGIVAKMESND